MDRLLEFNSLSRIIAFQLTSYTGLHWINSERTQGDALWEVEHGPVRVAAIGDAAMPYYISYHVRDLTFLMPCVRDKALAFEQVRDSVATPLRRGFL